MGLAVDSIAFYVANAGAAPSAGNVTLYAGDSAQVRYFPPSGKAYLDVLARQGATEGYIELRSPLLHDNVRGLHFITTESPTVLLLPREIGQPMRSADTTTLTISGGTAETDSGFAGLYYTDLPGAQAKLHSSAEILPNVVNLKNIEIDFTVSSNTWTDTVITTTENLLKADTSYALLGYVTDVAVLALGLKGPETANLRICGPGPTTTFPTDDYFVKMSDRHGRPYIPTFNANNRAALFVSCAAVGTPSVKANLLCAELAAGFQI